MNGPAPRFAYSGKVPACCPRCGGGRVQVEQRSVQPFRCLDCWHRWMPEEAGPQPIAEPAPPPPPRPDWLRVQATAWARFGCQGWSPCIVLRVREASGEAVIQFTRRKPSFRMGRPQEGIRTYDRLAPRDPAQKGADRPPRPIWRPDERRDCRGGAWGAEDACMEHEGLPIGADGYCAEGRPRSSPSPLECSCEEAPPDRSFADPHAHEPACGYRRKSV